MRNTAIYALNIFARFFGILGVAKLPIASTWTILDVSCRRSLTAGALVFEELGKLEHIPSLEKFLSRL